MALPGEPNSKEGESQDVSNNNGANNKDPSNDAAHSKTAATSVDHDDKDFDPTVEALIDEMDDERTLEEEEALDGNNATAVQNELDELKKESEMPIEELLAYYERMRNEAGEPEEEEDEGEVDEEDEEEEYEDEMDDSEVRKQESQSKLSTDANKCTNSESLQQNHNYHHQQRPQQQQQPDSSLITPPQPHQTLDHLNHSVHSDSDLVVSNERERRIDLEQNLDCATVSSLGKELVINRQQSSTSEPNMTSDNSNPVTSTARHKHSLTEFMIDDENVKSGMFKTLLDYDLDDSDDLDEDYSYTDDERADDERDWRRFIHIGPDYQADVPEGLSEYEGDLPPYEPQDKLVWRCNANLTHEQILDYLKRASSLSKRNDISVSPASVPKISVDCARLYKEKLIDASVQPNPRLHPVEQNHELINADYPPENLQDVYMTQSRKRARIDYELEQENAMDGINQSCGDNHPINYIAHSTREDNSSSISQDARPELSTEEYFQDEEQLLYLLLQCNFNLEEAIRRRGLDPSKYYLHEPMSLWSQDECLGFEHGLRIYGKDFRSIRENNVPTRTHTELVAFYYLWKKSERHDVYTNQYKLDRKRSLTHPGTTDYMDKFIEDNESALNASSNPTPTPTDSTAEINQVVDPPLVSSNSTSLSVCQENTFDSKPTQMSCLSSPPKQSITSAISDGNDCELGKISRSENCEQMKPTNIDNELPPQ